MLNKYPMDLLHVDLYTAINGCPKQCKISRQLTMKNKWLCIASSGVLLEVLHNTDCCEAVNLRVV